MDQLAHEGTFVHSDLLRYDAMPGHILIIGQIACVGDIVITVEKYLAVLDRDADSGKVIAGEEHDALVQTVLYSYNGSVRGHGNFMRYDNTHVWPGHIDKHHRHDIDWRTGDSAGHVTWLGHAQWPTLAEAIWSFGTWYFQNRGSLPRPDEIAHIEMVSPRIAMP